MERRERLLLAYEENIITAEKYFPLNDLNKSKNLGFLYWQHVSFELDLLTNAECKSEFRNQSKIEMTYTDLLKS